MSESFAKQHGLVVHSGDEHRGIFKTGSGEFIQSIGRTYVPLSLFGNRQSIERRRFHVLPRRADFLSLSFFTPPPGLSNFKFLFLQGNDDANSRH